MKLLRPECCPILTRLPVFIGLLILASNPVHSQSPQPIESLQHIESPQLIESPESELAQNGVSDFLQYYCANCHNDERMSGNWSLSGLDVTDPSHGQNLAAWENILRATDRGEMPPADREQPDPGNMLSFTSWLENSLDTQSQEQPNPGRATLRRLNRAEYSNAIRDLLDLDIDLADALPGDDSGYGFDNNADVLSVSTTLMETYISVAGKVSRLALGLTNSIASTTSYTVPKDGAVKNQGVPSFNQRMSDDLPIDSRGGGVFDYYAPQDGIYEISGYLNANTANEVDRIQPTRVAYRLNLSAGEHSIGMSFRRELGLDESVQTLKSDTSIVVLPTEAPSLKTLDFIVDGARVSTTEVPSYHVSSRFSQFNHLRDVMQIEVTGPFETFGRGDTASRRKILLCDPQNSELSETQCAEQIISTLAYEGYRRPTTEADVQPLMAIYEGARENADFENSIATAIQALLVSPNFLYLFEQSPADAEPDDLYEISDYEFAARLALFLWSSLPDTELLDLAEQGELRQDSTLRNQVERMLADPKAQALTQNFAGQWLYLRNLEYQFPDVFEFPQFNQNLRQAMLQESELFFASIVRDNLSVFEFLQADYSYLNESLAEHYGVEGVKGSAFRKVDFEPEHNRGGLLGQASILTVTSFANHTSPVRRGKWILDNLLAATPPPPPPDIPALIAEHNGQMLTAREQMALHREDPACASCHLRMDPLGLSLEKYDAIGAFREMDAGQPIDASAVMPNGTAFDGLPGLQEILIDKKEQFAQAFIDRLMTYALSRGLEATDQPYIRTIARAAEQEDYRVQAIIYAIAASEPFNLRRVP